MNKVEAQAILEEAREHVPEMMDDTDLFVVFSSSFNAGVINRCMKVTNKKVGLIRVSKGRRKWYVWKSFLPLSRKPAAIFFKHAKVLEEDFCEELIEWLCNSSFNGNEVNLWMYHIEIR